MLDVYIKSLLKDRDCVGIGYAVSGVFVNKCLTLSAGKDENQMHFTSSTTFLLEKVSEINCSLIFNPYPSSCLLEDHSREAETDSKNLLLLTEYLLNETFCQ